MLAVLLVSIVGRGYSAFYQTHITLDVFLDPAKITVDGKTDPDTLMAADYQGLVKNTLKGMFPEVTKRGDLRSLYAMVSNSAGDQSARRCWRTRPSSARPSASPCPPTTISTCSIRASSIGMWSRPSGS